MNSDLKLPPKLSPALLKDSKHTREALASQATTSSSQDTIDSPGLYPFLLPLPVLPVPELVASPIAATSSESSPVFYDQRPLTPMPFFTQNAKDRRLKQLESLPTVPATSLDSMPVREIIDETSLVVSMI